MPMAARSPLTLSDSFCVDRYRGEFLGLIQSKMVDIVFANESELKSLYETADFDTALVALKGDASLGRCPREANRAVVVVEGGTTIAVPAASIDTLIDTTGAGDLFAAGFLHGYTSGAGHEASARLGGLAAAHIIQKIGARPSVDLKQLAEQHGMKI